VRVPTPAPERATLEAAGNQTDCAPPSDLASRNALAVRASRRAPAGVAHGARWDCRKRLALHERSWKEYVYTWPAGKAALAAAEAFAYAPMRF